MVRLTYGVLPSLEDFEAAFRRETVSTKGWYRISNCKRVGTGSFTCAELWNELDMATSENECTDESLDWASCILYTLGFEWI